MAHTGKPRAVVASPMFDEVLQQLRAHFDVEANEGPEPWTGAAFIQRLRGKQGALLTGAQTVDQAALAQAPGLRMV